MGEIKTAHLLIHRPFRAHCDEWGNLSGTNWPFSPVLCNFRRNLRTYGTYELSPDRHNRVASRVYVCIMWITVGLSGDKWEALWIDASISRLQWGVSAGPEREACDRAYQRVVPCFLDATTTASMRRAG